MSPKPNVPTFRRVVGAWHSGNERRLPWRDVRDAYRVLIGEVLLQRTRGENAAETYLEFIRRWPDEASLANASVADIAAVIEPLGFRKRATYLAAIGDDLAARGGTSVDPMRLSELPGVGRYVANAVPIFAAGRRLPLVDWVIARVLRRYFGLRGDRRPNADEALWDLAETIASRGSARETWWAVLDFAALVCRPKPACPACPLASSCAFAWGRLT
jgi:A/G-specific adenine glycosylase